MTAPVSHHFSGLRGGTRRVRVVALGLLAVSSLAGASACSSGDGGSGETVTVTVKDMVFDPASVTIKPGDTVKWVWDAALPHDVVSDEGSPAEYNSELMTEGEYSYTYEEAGTYGYHCTPHPMMTGEVIVQE